MILSSIEFSQKENEREDEGKLHRRKASSPFL